MKNNSLLIMYTQKMSFSYFRGHKHIKKLTITVILLIVTFCIVNTLGRNSSKKNTPKLSFDSNLNLENLSIAYTVEKKYDPATTTITLPTSGYSTKIIPLPPVRSLAQLSKHANSFRGAYPYYEYYVKNVEKFGDIASRLIDESLGVEEIRKFDVDMDGKDETIVTMCDYIANGCPHKFIIVKDNKIIFSVIQGGRHLSLIKTETGNGFYVYWTPINGTVDETSYCCPTVHMKTRFIYSNGIFNPSSEQKIKATEY